MDISKLTITGPNGEAYRLVQLDKVEAPTKYEQMSPAAFADSIMTLKDRYGIGWRALARSSGISNATLVDIRKKRKKRINPTTMRSIVEAFERLKA